MSRSTIYHSDIQPVHLGQTKHRTRPEALNASREYLSRQRGEVSHQLKMLRAVCRNEDSDLYLQHLVGKEAFRHKRIGHVLICG